MEDLDKSVIDRIENLTGVEYSDEQRAVLNHHGGMCILACAGSGKALMNGTPVLTSCGWRKIEELRLKKDKVYDDMGSACLVRGIFPQGKKQAYRVRFSDDSYVICSPDHLWFIGLKQGDILGVKSDEPVVCDTNRIMSELSQGSIIRIPKVKPIKFAKSALGNDEVARASIEDIRSLLDDIISLTFNKDVNNLNSRLLYGEVPLRRDYLFRLFELYAERGLAVSTEEDTVIVFKNRALGRDVMNLVQSLGVTCSLYDSNFKVVDSVSLDVFDGWSKFCTEMRVNPKDSLYERYGISINQEESYILHIDSTMRSRRLQYNAVDRLIVGVDDLGYTCDMTCIYVGSPGHLFVTRDYIITHNTTILTHLIAKRLSTFEIKDADKLLCTTYSKSGAEELEVRLNGLLSKVGISRKVKVMTMHALYLSILKYFGFPSAVISQKNRTRMIREACKDAEVKITDDDLMTLDSLMSYQVNNMLSDDELVRSYVYTLTDLSLDKYKKVRDGYARKKVDSGVIDFDDMQLYIYCLIYQYKRMDVLEYCRNNWTDIYVDEAQDMSKIQYFILKALISDSNKMVIIGDDDQCLVKGTRVYTVNGVKVIEDIKEGDMVLTSEGNNTTGYHEVDKVWKRKNRTHSVLVVKMDTGYEIRGTVEHIAFVRDVIKMDNPCDLIINVDGYDYLPVKFGELRVGMHMPVVDKVSGNIFDSSIISLEKEDYDGYVYDLSIPETRNFIANDIVVHNCIYQWRGADPSIMLDICAEYDISRFVLSTNYRCAGNIVERATVGIVHNKLRSEKSMRPYKAGGDIKVCDCGSSNLYTMSKYAYKHIKRLVLEDKVPLDHIAILSRNNAHLSILGSMLFKDGIYCEMAKEMKLTQGMIYKNIKGVMDLAEDGYDAGATETILFTICSYLSFTNSKALAHVQEASGMLFSDMLGYILKRYFKRNIEFNSKVNIPASAELMLEHICEGISYKTVEALQYIYYLMQVKDMVQRTTEMIRLFVDNIQYRYKGNMDKLRELNGVADYVCDLIKTQGYEKVRQFLSLSEQYEAGNLVVPGDLICMSTMHGSKGREWEYVVLFADDNVTFPSFSNILTQLEQGISNRDIFYSIDENRRLHYVAMTRAKKELAIFTDRRNVGVYLLEAFGIFDSPTNDEYILEMAKFGIYPELVQLSDNIMFSKDSPFNYKIDISDVKGEVEDAYFN